jgi:molecular chaperone GrpE
VAKKNQKETHNATEQPPEDVLSQETVEQEATMQDATHTVDETTTATVNEQTQASGNPDLITELEAEVEKNKQGWQRTLAEFQNYKRRTEREQTQLHQKIKSDVLAQVLPIIDDFERAMANLPDTLKDEPWLDGIRLIQDKFVKHLAENNVTTIDPTGDAFDPTLHQAIARDDSDTVESGHVIETLQKGYIVGETLLRPALVRVAN